MVHFSALFQLALASTLVAPSFAALYTTPSQLPTHVYDYIIVGAGTAGNVIANRLTENSAVNVLVLEAGVSNADVTAAIVPLLGPTLEPNTLYDWNYTTVNQTGFNGRAVKMPRGRMLGGSSSVNYMTYNRGSLDDFNRLASVSGSPIWQWSALQPYILKLEHFVAPADNHDTTGQYNPAIHGTQGLLQMSLSGFSTYLDGAVIQTTKDLASEFPFNEDMNSGNPIGMGWVQATIGGGERSSSATAYLADQYINRSNLHVLINAQVTKLRQTGTVHGLPSFLCVEFAAVNGVPSASAISSVTAKKEVVLSAGTIGTPAILQLSGIGDPSMLTPLGIKTLVKNPSVGANLTDHVLLFNDFEVNSNQSFDDLFRNATLANAAMAEWQATKTGELVYPVTNQLGWFRLPSNSSIFKTIRDPSAGPTSAHYEFIFLNFLLGAVLPPSGHFVTIATGVISPTARGTVKLASSNPFTAPLVDPRYLTTAFDTYTVVEAVKAVKRFVAAPAWKNIIAGPFGPLSLANTDAEILSYARSNANAMLHPVGTAAMSPVGAKWGVVDPDLKVKGAHGIRVVDGSVLTYVPTAHTQGPIYILAERAADLIKAS